ncbi:MAG: hypothetical protein DLM55_07255 [Acidimicrobiales bacterium]|nr:MAG: hypothetical protein DLM55_07255 [Acidimicrobiales bacterium]
MSQRDKKKKPHTSSGAGGKQSSAGSAPPKQTPRRSREPRMVDQQRIAAHRSTQRRRSVTYRSLLGAGILLIAAVVGWVVYRTLQPSDLPDRTARPATHYAIPHGATREGVTIGQDNAPAKVDLYVDFECPHCRDFERAVGNYFAQQVQSGSVKLTYHPISILNGYSVWAAAAAGCASDKDALPRFTTEVFKQNGRLTRDDLVKVGKLSGLDSPEFATCVRKSTYQDWALGLTNASDKAGVTGTPTVAVNGKQLLPKPRSSMEDFIEQLKHAIADAAANSGSSAAPTHDAAK